MLAVGIGLIDTVALPLALLLHIVELASLTLTKECVNTPATAVDAVIEMLFPLVVVIKGCITPLIV